jgi:uncharacterized protein YkwD
MSWLSDWFHRLFPPRPTPPDPIPRPVPGPVGPVPERMLAAHNAARALRGLKPYRLSADLCRLAQGHSEDMAVQSNSMRDTSKAQNHDGWLDRLRAAGYPPGNGSENVAWASFDQSPEAATRGWLESPVGHRENVLSARWADAGFGVAKNRKGEPYWTALYGVRP